MLERDVAGRLLAGLLALTTQIHETLIAPGKPVFEQSRGVDSADGASGRSQSSPEQHVQNIAATTSAATPRSPPKIAGPTKSSGTPAAIVAAK